MLGEITLKALVEEAGEARAAARLRNRGREIGEALIRDLENRARVQRWTPETFERVVLREHFREQGAPNEVIDRSKDKLVYRSFHCPFLEIAEKLPDLVCDALDLGFHDGVDRAIGDVRTERLACMGHGSAYCEYKMVWGADTSRKS